MKSFWLVKEANTTELYLAATSLAAFSTYTTYPSTTQCLGDWVWPIAVIRDDIQYKSCCHHIWHRRGDQQCMGGRVLPIDHSPLGALSLPVGFHHYSIQRPQQSPIEKYINLLFIYSWHLRYPLISYGHMLTSLTRAIRGSTRRALWDDRLTRRAWVMTLVSQGGPDLTTNRTWWITLLYPQHCTYTHIVVDPATSCTEELQSNSKAGILTPCFNKLSTRPKKVLCFGATYLLTR